MKVSEAMRLSGRSEQFWLLRCRAFDAKKVPCRSGWRYEISEKLYAAAMTYAKPRYNKAGAEKRVRKITTVLDERLYEKLHVLSFERDETISSLIFKAIKGTYENN